MMRKFVHKQLGWVADFGYLLDGKLVAVSEKENDNTCRSVPKKLIENSQDRQEVVETDWFDDAINSYKANYCSTQNRKDELTQAIEKHAPKLKKITRDEIETERNKQSLSLDTLDFTVAVLRNKGLLEE